MNKGRGGTVFVYFVCLAGALLLPGCRSLAPVAFSSAEPLFEPESYFEGPTHSWGVMETPNGAPTGRFSTEMEGVRTGDALVLTQHFQYDDGRTEQRVWHVRRLDSHHYEGSAGDVVGTAKGEAFGNAFRWDYTLALTSGGIVGHVHVQQWMYLQADGETMVNRVAISKLGVLVGQTTEFFRRGTAKP